jgi:hypothetical protein
LASQYTPLESSLSPVGAATDPATRHPKTRSFCEPRDLSANFKLDFYREIGEMGIS